MGESPNSAAYRTLVSQLEKVEGVLLRIHSGANVRERAMACAELGPAMTELEDLKARVEASLSAAEAHELAQRGVRLAAELQAVKGHLLNLRDRWGSETN